MKTINVKTIEFFYDELSSTNREIGDVFEVDEKRLEVLQGKNSYKKPFVEIVKDEIDFSKMKKDELQKKLDEAGIEYDKRATNEKLVALLSKANA